MNRFDLSREDTPFCRTVGTGKIRGSQLTQGHVEIANVLFYPEYFNS